MTVQGRSIFTRNCISCNTIDFAEAQRTLFTTKHCRVILRTDDQAWLGRCIIVPRRHISTFDQMLPKERQDIYDCREKVNKVYKKLFGMTYDNWAQLGNLTRDHENQETTDLRYFHMHYHIIPRYQTPVEYLGKRFVDVQFGKPLNIDPARGHTKVVLSAEELLNLRNDIQVELIKQNLISKKNLADTGYTDAYENMFAFREQQRKSKLTVWLSGTAAALVIAAGIFGVLKSKK